MSSVEIAASVIQEPKQIQATILSQPKQVAATIINVGVNGLRGSDGLGSSSGTVGPITVSSGNAIVLINGLLYPADPTDITQAGLPIFIASQTGTTGTTIDYQSSGDIGGGAYTQGAVYFVGLNGVLSTTFRATGAAWAKTIGAAKSSTTLSIEMGPTLVLAP